MIVLLQNVYSTHSQRMLYYSFPESKMYKYLFVVCLVVLAVALAVEGQGEFYTIHLCLMH